MKKSHLVRVIKVVSSCFRLGYFFVIRDVQFRCRRTSPVNTELNIYIYIYIYIYIDGSGCTKSIRGFFSRGFCTPGDRYRTRTGTPALFQLIF